MSILSLQDILWEITPLCNKNCDYCGSKELKTKQSLTKKYVDIIIDNLINYSPKELTITGGEPGCFLDLSEIIDKLKDYMKIKIITNGEIFNILKEKDINNIEQIGLSINTLEEIENIKKLDKKTKLFNYHKKITMITNFGTHNIWDFEKIKQFFSNIGFSLWQVQLTMGEYLLNSDGIEHLYNKLFSDNNIKDVDKEQKLVLADNLQLCHECKAGINTCSITYDGNIIPCLSERSWNKKIVSEGNLISEKFFKNIKYNKRFEYIWKNKFKDIRFKNSMCCRDHIKYPLKELNIKNVPIEEFDKWLIKDNSSVNPIKIPQTQIIMYGVGTPTYVYGVFSDSTK